MSHQIYYQQQQRVQTVQDQEMRYVVQQDFLNFIGIANDVQEVINYFGPDSNHIMIDIYMNKLILQTNLSNGIHVDQNAQAQQNGKIAELNNQKAQINQHLDILLKQKYFDPRIIQYIQKYKENSLSNSPFLNQSQGKEINLKSKFDEKVVDKVVQNIMVQDQQFERIRQGERIQVLDQTQIQNHLKNRSTIAQQKLNQNWRDKRNDQIYYSQPQTCECRVF